HGISATPLQIAAAYGAIANGGVWRQPYLVKKVISEDTNEEVPLPERRQRRVLSQDDAATLTLMLSNVTSPTGTGFNARIKGFPVAGKTGTAQKVDLVKGGYFKDAYISSFAGFVPANDPRFVIYIAVDNPRVKYYGAQVAAPVFARLASFVVRKSGLPPILISEENILAARVKAVEPEQAQEKSLKIVKEALKIGEGGVTPDFSGMTLREVVRRVRGTDFKVRFKGSGVVASTRPAAGEPLRPGQDIHLQLKTPKTQKE
ncbi:MAG: PASTA domain-containing protein, partial [Bdellovibrionales bacterium]|nr:PASTA domain-containing protein [Bdellovibrionales bacterium]